MGKKSKPGSPESRKAVMCQPCEGRGRTKRYVKFKNGANKGAPVESQCNACKGYGIPQP